MKHLLTLLLSLCPLAAAAQSSGTPKSVSDCEKIRNDLAYNQCLASFGPKRGEKAMGDMNVGEGDDGPAAVASRGRKSVARTHGGRQTAVFDVVSGKGGAARRRR